MQLYELAATEMARGVRAGEFSASEVLESCLGRIEEGEGALAAMITVTAGKAREEAALVDGMVARGEDPGPLAGVPLILKDNICMRGAPVTCASKMLENWVPPYDAAVVEMAAASGALFPGKANMDEFAMGNSGEFSVFTHPSNPWDTDRAPGGSSGGCAAAVAAGYAPLALGTDTGGSVRQPASFCGIYGLKPTWGLASRRGVVPLAPTMDQVGPFARTAEDLALVLSVISAPDGGDGTCRPGQRPDYGAAVATPSLKGKRVAVIRDLDGLSSLLDDAVLDGLSKFLDLCRDGGAEIVDVSLPVTVEFGPPCYHVLSRAEAASSLARYDGVRYGLSKRGESLSELYTLTRGEGFGPESKRRVLMGTWVMSGANFDEYYTAAAKTRTLIVREFDDAFKGCDIIALPTAPGPAFIKGTQGGERMRMANLLTLPPNLAGLPALSMNMGFTGGDKPLPVGVQLIAPRWGEAELLNAAAAVEKSVGGATVAPLPAGGKGGEAR